MVESLNSNLFLDSVLVVALHEQRPDLDRDIIDTTSNHVKAYRQRLAVITPELATPEAPAPLFEPQKALLWGPYDHATFFLSDDLEAVEQVSYGSGATAQEFLFGSPYLLDDTADGLPTGIRELFHRDPQQALPLLAISRVKLGDHLLATLGGCLREAVARRIYEKALTAQADFASRVIPIILRCWSWPDLVVILLADDPRALAEVITATEHLTIDDVFPEESPYHPQLLAALQHPIPRHLLALWTLGKQASLGDDRPSSDHEDLLAIIGQCDVVVSEKTQVGIPLSGWKQFAKDDLGEETGELFDAMSCAFEPSEAGRFVAAIIEGKKFDFPEKLAACHRKLQPVCPEEHFVARIAVQAKPGHLATVEDFARKIVATIGSGYISLGMSCGGQGLGLVLTASIPPTRQGFVFLFCLSHSFRVCASVHQHLLDVSTTLDWQVRTPSRRQKASTFGTVRGYDLLRFRTSEEIRHLRRFRTMRAGVGRVQGLALRALGSAVVQAGSRPELFGAIMELYDVTLAMDMDLVYGRDDVSEALARQIETIMPYAQKAYQQRLQFSPILSGAPPLNGQLPYGINQIVRMVDGLATILTAASLLPFEARGHDSFGRSYRKLIVIFEAEAAIAVRNAYDFGVLQLSLLQALTPLSLTALFHELGHFLVRRCCWHSRTPPTDKLNREGIQEWMVEVRCWREARWDLLKKIQEKFYETENNGRAGREEEPHYRNEPKAQAVHWEKRILTFLEDVFAHATWRRVGCGRSFELFSGQFLAVQAMGIRCEALLSEPLTALDAWALTSIHLAIQRALSETNESVTKGFRRFLSWIIDADADAWWREHLEQILPYAEGEIACAARRISNPASQPQPGEILRLSIYRWLPALGILGTSGTEAQAYRRHLEHFSAAVDLLEQSLEDCDQDLRRHSVTYREISSRICRGETTGCDLPWDSLIAKNGLPGPGALLWMRSILNSVTEHFLETHRQRASKTRSIHRDHRLILVPPDPDRPLRGLFSDFIGGLFIAGKEERQDYLRVRLAAIESLAELASRTQAEAIRLRFLRRRSYKRSPLGEWAILRINAVSQSVWVRDISAGGLGIVLSNGQRINDGSNLEVEALDGTLLKCRIAWSKVEGTKTRMGLKLISPQQRDGKHETVVPQLEKIWLRLDDDRRREEP